MATSFSNEDVLTNFDNWKEMLSISMEFLLKNLHCESAIPYLDHAIRHIHNRDILDFHISDLQSSIKNLSATLSDLGVLLETKEQLGILLSIPREGERHSNVIQPSNDMNKRTASKLEEDISSFITKKKAQVIAINEKEFIEPNRHLETSCVRADMRRVDRAVQMKRDFVENFDGPLARTTLHLLEKIKDQVPPSYLQDANRITGKKSLGPASRHITDRISDLLSLTPMPPPLLKGSSTGHAPVRYVNPGLNERLATIESFLVRRDLPENDSAQLPPISADIYARLQRLENALLHIETKYPAVALASLNYNEIHSR